MPLYLKLITLLMLPITLTSCAKAQGALAPTDENKDELFNLWHWLMNLSPKGYIAPVACIFAACAYESGESELAHNGLLSALADCPNYPLALLLRRVFTAAWPADSFAMMRAQLHPKICSSLFGSSF